jgi:hypothetical protein
MGTCATNKKIPKNNVISKSKSPNESDSDENLDEAECK